MEVNENKFYCPFCRIPGCDGVLKIKINRNDFSLDYECDKNEEHNGQNIYFKTFERFYLKEMIKDKCKRCNCFLENNLIYQCKLCEKHFCSSCFIFDKHIKQNVNNLLIISTKCKKHNTNIMHYCIKCKEYLCNYCLKNKNIHEEHFTEDLYDLMPSKQKIQTIKNRIREYDDLINDIDIWIKEFNQKIYRLKNNLIDEKELFAKLILNFNQSFINYSYFENFSCLDNYSKSFNNEFLDNFSKSATFKDKCQIIFDYIIHEENKINKEVPEIEINDDNKLINCNIFNNSIIVKIKNNYFFKHSNKDKLMEVVKIKIKNDKIVESKKVHLKFSYEIYNISIFKNLDKNYTIYACLANNKKVILFNLDLKNYELSKNNNVIIKPGAGRFKKVIQLPNELVVTSDNDYIIDIWIKEETNEDGYSHLNSIILEYSIIDLLLVNSEYFISSQDNNQINFYDIKSLSIEKSLNNIDCSPQKNSLLLYNDQYIIINCENGFALIYIKTKEFVQYIEDYTKNYEIKEIFLNSNNNIYIMYLYKYNKEDNSDNFDNFDNSDNSEIIFTKKYKIKIFTIKYNDLSFQISEIYKNIKTNEKLHLICINHKDLMLWDKNIYLLE